MHDDDAPVTNALRLADHEILREIGRGGMGVVYLARQRMLDRLEVLKVMNESLVRDAHAAERFLREIRAAAKLQHPNIVTAYSASMVDRTLAFAMEYVEGVDLTKMIAARGPLSVGEACCYIRDAAQGLQHAHERGMVHRDIKPSNLIVAKRDGLATVKILDFGLSKAASESPALGALTHTGQFLGTPDYISPEQARDASTADIRSDIYSLGCTLYYLLVGSPPFKGGALAVLRAHETESPLSAVALRAELPQELDLILKKMLAKSPADRFVAPSEVAAALAPFAIATSFDSLPIAPASTNIRAAIDTKSRAAELTEIAKLPIQRDEIDPHAIPWPVRVFPAFCMLVTGICLCILLLIPIVLWSQFNPDLFGITPSTSKQRLEEIEGMFIIGIPSLIGAVAYVAGCALKRRPSTWAFGLLLLLGGVFFIIPCPFGLAVAYFWVQEPTRRYFETS